MTPISTLLFQHVIQTLFQKQTSMKLFRHLDFPSNGCTPATPLIQVHNLSLAPRAALQPLNLLLQSAKLFINIKLTSN
jgi:hypothetical protein